MKDTPRHLMDLFDLIIYPMECRSFRRSSFLLLVEYRL